MLQVLENTSCSIYCFYVLERQNFTSSQLCCHCLQFSSSNSEKFLHHQYINPQHFSKQILANRNNKPRDTESKGNLGNLGLLGNAAFLNTDCCTSILVYCVAFENTGTPMSGFFVLVLEHKNQGDKNLLSVWKEVEGRFFQPLANQLKMKPNFEKRLGKSTSTCVYEFQVS